MGSISVLLTYLGGLIMALNDKDIINESIVTIHAGKLLDFSIARQVFQICDMAKKAMTKIILIDLSNTYQIMDSGLALLSYLDKCTEDQVQAINFINCKPMIRKTLMERYFNYGKTTYSRQNNT